MPTRRPNRLVSGTRKWHRRKRSTVPSSPNSSCLTTPSAHSKIRQGRYTASSKALTRQAPAWRNGIERAWSALARRREHRAVPKHVGQLALEILYLGQVVVDDVGHVRVVDQVILVVGLGRI